MMQISMTIIINYVLYHFPIANTQSDAVLITVITISVIVSIIIFITIIIVPLVAKAMMNKEIGNPYQILLAVRMYHLQTGKPKNNE